MSLESFIRRLFGHRRKKVIPPLGYEQALALGHLDAIRHWQKKNGKGYKLTTPKCVWVAEPQWTTDDNGKPLEMGGWCLGKYAYAMWVGQYPLRGSIQHECEHCFDLQAFGKTSEESVR